MTPSRHTSAIDTLVNRVGIAQVAEVMGHASTEMVRTFYGQLADKVDQ